METFLNVHDKQTVFELFNPDLDNFLITQLLNLLHEIGCIQVPPPEREMRAIVQIGPDKSLLLLNILNLVCILPHQQDILIIRVGIFLKGHNIKFLILNIPFLNDYRPIPDLISSFEKCK